jgi:hypothetical protein
MNLALRPEFLLILLFGVLCGAVFHLWRGRSLSDFMIFIAVGVLGFGLGAWLGSKSGLQVLTIGQLHPVTGVLVSVGLLFVARWLKT